LLEGGAAAPGAEDRVNALQTIENEHRSLAAVLDGLLHVVHGIRDHGATPDFDLLSAMVYYIDEFPERLHHPKEDRYLFAALRARCPEAAELLDGLRHEHREGARRMRELEQLLFRYREGGPAEFAAFANAVESFAAFENEHMRKEEHGVLPLARIHLTALDWQEVDAAFAANADPLQGGAEGRRFEQLFTRIVSLAPPPIGVGPAR
jgi:hemerythrin-like domain-containing protein